MQRLLPLVFLLVSACQEPPRPRTAVELLCQPAGKPAARGEFYWDEVRRSDRPSFDRAREICSRRCPRSASCGPVLSVARWYTAPPEPFDEESAVPEDALPPGGDSR